MLSVTLWHFLGHDIWHPLKGDGYQFWSGIAGTVLFSGGIYAVAINNLRKHNCHVHRCWRVGRHPVEGTAYIVCRRHHPHDHVTAEQVLDEHVAAVDGSVRVR